MKYRIIQTSNTSFEIQKKFLFLWLEIGEYYNTFNTQQEAEEWLEEYLEYETPKVMKEIET